MRRSPRMLPGAEHDAPAAPAGRGDTVTLVHDAARLVQFGLRKKARPADDEDYRALVYRYQTSAGFRETVDALLEGLGLVVLDVGAYGAVLAPTSGAVF